MAKYRRKVTYCNAEQFTSTYTPRGVNTKEGKDGVYVTTIQGQDVRVYYGEWIVAENDGKHFYPIADTEFKRIYEKVED